MSLDACMIDWAAEAREKGFTSAARGEGAPEKPVLDPQDPSASYSRNLWHSFWMLGYEAFHQRGR